MPAFNRYDDISTSTYTPRSLQETLMVPMMRRQQHDQAQAQLQAQVGELDKIDPLDVHFKEAQEIKSNLLSQIDKQAQQLATQGFNTQTTGDVFKTNRLIKEQFSPTGRAGQINAAKVAYAKQLNDYIEDATKTKGWSREQALRNWQDQHVKSYTGYDDQRGIQQISPYGAPIKVDRMQKLKDIKSLLGEQVVSELGGQSFQLMPQADGSVIAVDGSGRRIETSNKPNLQEALKLVQAQLAPGGEWASSIKFEGVPMQNVQSEMLHGINAMLANKVVDNRDVSHTLHGYKNEKPEELADLEAVNVEAVPVASYGSLLGKLNDHTPMTGQPIDVVASRAGVKQDLSVKKGTKTISQETMDSPEYKTLANNIARTYPEYGKMKYNDPKLVKKVKEYLETHKDVTVQNKYNDPNTDRTANLFANKNIPKDKKAASQNLLDRVMSKGSEMRDLEGNVIDPNDIKSFTYSGDMTPKSQINVFGNPKQNVLAHRGYIMNKKNEIQQVYVSRGADDFDTPQFKAAETINAISKIADLSPNIYHKVNSDLFKAHGLSDVDIKFNPGKGKGTYNVRWKDPKGKRESHEYTNAEFFNMIHDGYNQLGQ